MANYNLLKTYRLVTNNEFVSVCVCLCVRLHNKQDLIIHIHFNKGEYPLYSLLSLNIGRITIQTPTHTHNYFLFLNDFVDVFSINVTVIFLLHSQIHTHTYIHSMLSRSRAFSSLPSFLFPHYLLAYLLYCTQHNTQTLII